MTVLTKEQFEEFIEEFPEMEQCYDFSREALDYWFENTIEEY